MAFIESTHDLIYDEGVIIIVLPKMQLNVVSIIMIVLWNIEKVPIVLVARAMGFWSEVSGSIPASDSLMSNRVTLIFHLEI